MTAAQGAVAAVDTACNPAMSIVMKKTRKSSPSQSTGLGCRGSPRLEIPSASAEGSMTRRFSQKLMRQPA